MNYRIVHTTLASVIVVSASFFASAEGPDERAEQKAVAWGPAINGIQVGILLKNRSPIAIGSKAQLEMVARNTTDKDVAIRFPNSYYKVFPTSVAGLR